MPRGKADIPELRLEVLQNFITQFMSPPDLMLMNLFGSSPSPSSTVKWESMRGGRGMTPFVAPGSPSPRTAPFGIAQHIAEAAYWKEKMYFDEEFLNNLRKEGTEGEYLDSKTRLARELAGLVNRSNRRKEWMFAQMIFNNGFNYMRKGGYMSSVDYQIPSDHRVTLAGNARWGETAANIIGDIRDAKRKVKEDCGGKINYAICNSTVLAMLADDDTIRELLQKNMFGEGNLFGSGGGNDFVEANANVIARLLDIPNIAVYDEMYEIKSWITSTLSGGSSTWISVQDASDFTAFETVRIHNNTTGAYEDRVILSVDTFTNQLQIEYPTDNSYKAGLDSVAMRKYFVPDNKIVFMSTSIDGEAIAEYKQAPFGLGRQYGLQTDKHEEWDPEGIFIRVRDKGLPILYHRDAIYSIEVATTAAASATSTTTTSSSTTTTTTA